MADRYLFTNFNTTERSGKYSLRKYTPVGKKLTSILEESKLPGITRIIRPFISIILPCVTLLAGKPGCKNKSLLTGFGNNLICKLSALSAITVDGDVLTAVPFNFPSIEWAVILNQILSPLKGWNYSIDKKYLLLPVQLV